MIKSSKYVKKIRSTNVYDVANKSPITKAEGLSLQYGNNILLKREEPSRPQPIIKIFFILI